MESLAEKVCRTCNKTKPVEAFSRDRTSKSGRRSKCKECANAYNRKWRSNNYEYAKGWWVDRGTDRVLEYKMRRHGLTAEKYHKMLTDQGGVCASCGSAEPGGNRQRFCVDHDHACCPGPYSCGKCVRGLVCINCNYLAGHIESPRGQHVLAYLERWRGGEPCT